MRRMLLLVGLVGTWWWLSGDDSDGDNSPASEAQLQAAVLQDGFAVHADRRVIELDTRGHKRDEHTIERSGEIRVVGTRQGPAAAWLESKKLRLANMEGRELGVWGKAARMLCEGVATNDVRFAVGWLESDGGIWFVHGPTGGARASHVDEPVLATTADSKNWCGVASAEDNVALFWRDRDRLLINSCTQKKCSPLPASVAFSRDEVLLGFGCLKKACLIAARDRGGKSRLAYVTDAGSTKWTLPLPTSTLEVSIVGAGNRAFAVGHLTSTGSEVIRVDSKGVSTRVWQGPLDGGVPVLAWSRDQLLVAHRGGHSVVRLGR